MKVLVDTSIWSHALRRPEGTQNPHREELHRLVDAGLVEIIGPIRQELLSGIREESSFTRVRDALRSFEDLPLDSTLFEEAASCFNRCRSKGIQGSNTDFLLCAAALRHRLAIYTDDQDFPAYAKVLNLRLHRIAT